MFRALALVYKKRTGSPLLYLTGWLLEGVISSGSIKPTSTVIS